MASRPRTDRKAALPNLNLADLRNGAAHEFTPSFGAALAEAATVCLDDRGHASGASMWVDGSVAKAFALRWRRGTERYRRTWADEEVATEYGAYGIAALLVRACWNGRLVERARKGKGFDFWVAPDGSSGPLFQNKQRLEVSGIRSGDEATIRSRVAAKSAQVGLGGSRGRIVIVVEFGAPQSRLLAR